MRRPAPLPRSAPLPRTALRAAALSAVALVGCAASTPSRAAPAHARPALDPGALAAWHAAAAPPAASAAPATSPDGPGASVLRRAEPAPRRVVRIRRPPLPRGRRGPRIDVRLHDAPLSQALTFLADAARLSIVVGEGLEERVSVSLRRVRPLEAMRALAAAHGVELAVLDRTVIARRSSDPAPAR